MCAPCASATSHLSGSHTDFHALLQTKSAIILEKVECSPGLDCRRRRADATHQINHILELPFLSARLKIKRQEFDAHEIEVGRVRPRMIYGLNCFGKFQSTTP